MVEWKTESGVRGKRKVESGKWRDVLDGFRDLYWAKRAENGHVVLVQRTCISDYAI